MGEFLWPRLYNPSILSKIDSIFFILFLVAVYILIYTFYQETRGLAIIIPTKYKTNILDKLLTFTGHKKVKQLLRVLKTTVNNLAFALSIKSWLIQITIVKSLIVDQSIVIALQSYCSVIKINQK